MRVALLGVMLVETDAGAPVDAGGTKQRSVLAQLCRSPNRAVGVDRLAEGVWGEQVPPRYRQNLQVYVSTLRRALEPARPADAPSRILGHGDAYELVGGPDEIDVVRFDRLCLDGFAALQDGRPVAAAEQLRDGLALWRGEPLVELAAQPFAADWIDELQERRLLAVEHRIDADLARGFHVGLVSELEGLVAAHPERERQWEQLLVALYRSGRQSEALAAYHRARAHLLELGLDPGPGLRELAAQVLQQDPALLGAPPPRSRQGAIPVPLTRALGRDADLEALLAHVRGGARLLVLTGPGGVGKTRLALAAAHALRESGRDVAWVPLADETSRESIAPAAARAVGVEGPRLQDAFAAEPRVLLLDNLEQLPGAGAVVRGWLEDAPGLQVVVTSRSPLGVAGEQVLAVQPLAPEVAAELFVERAASIVPAFDRERHAADVRALCEQLDGLPLALELAAARISAFAPADLAGQIASLGQEGDGGRHGSLRALVRWSTDLLDPPARALLARLAACDGALDPEEVATLAAAVGLDRAGAALAAAALVRAGLLLPLETDAGRRVAMLRTVRAVAADPAESARRAAVADLAALFLARARVTDPLAHADRPALAAARADLPLTRQVIAALAADGHADEAVEIVLADRKTLALLGRSDETLAAARALLGEPLDPVARSRLSVVAGGSAYVASDPAADQLLAAIEDLPAGDAVYRGLGHAWRCAVHADRREHEAAAREGDASIAVAVAAGSARLEWMARSAAAWSALLRGDAAAAVQHSRRQLELAETDSEVAYGLVDLANAELLRGQLDVAEACARDAVVAARRLGPSRTLAGALRCLGIAVLLRGDADAACALLVETERVTHRDSDVLALLELVAAIGVAVAACGEREVGAELVRRAQGFVRRLEPLAEALPAPLAGLARDLGLVPTGAAPSVPIGTVTELVEDALRSAAG